MMLRFWHPLPNNLAIFTYSNYLRNNKAYFSRSTTHNHKNYDTTHISWNTSSTAHWTINCDNKKYTVYWGTLVHNYYDHTLSSLSSDMWLVWCFREASSWDCPDPCSKMALKVSKLVISSRWRLGCWGGGGGGALPLLPLTPEWLEGRGCNNELLLLSTRLTHHFRTFQLLILLRNRLYYAEHTSLCSQFLMIKVNHLISILFQ